MKNLFVTVFVIALLSSCNFNKTAEYYILGVKAAKDKDWTNFELVKNIKFNGEFHSKTSYYFYFNNDSQHPYFVVEDTVRQCFTKIGDDVLVVNNQGRELARYHNTINNNALFIAYQAGQDIYNYLPFYLMSWPKKYWESYLPKVEEVNDTTINGVVCKDLVTYSQGFEYNEATEEFDIPKNFECHTWINTETSNIDSVIAFTVTNNDYQEEYKFYVKSLNFDDKSRCFDSVFNFDNEQYREYSRHSESFIQFEYCGTQTNDMLSMLDYPIISLKNDTTTLNDTKDFILLNFWCINCPNCLDNLREYKHQKDSLGYRIIEKNDIRIMAINYLSDNPDINSKIAGKTDSEDIIYSAKGIRRFVNIPFLGYYYLLSPDKKLIYETSNLGDYSELLKAKETWEKQHPNYETK